MDNGNIALRFEMKDDHDAQDDMTDVWKRLRDAKAKELEVKKQLNDMYQQKVEIFFVSLHVISPRIDRSECSGQRRYQSDASSDLQRHGKAKQSYSTDRRCEH